MSDARQKAGAIIERQITETTHRDVFTAAEVQDNLFEIYSALELYPDAEPIPALAQ